MQERDRVCERIKECLSKREFVRMCVTIVLWAQESILARPTIK